MLRHSGGCERAVRYRDRRNRQTVESLGSRPPSIRRSGDWINVELSTAIQHGKRIIRFSFQSLSLQLGQPSSQDLSVLKYSTERLYPPVTDQKDNRVQPRSRGVRGETGKTHRIPLLRGRQWIQQLGATPFLLQAGSPAPLLPYGRCSEGSMAYRAERVSKRDFASLTSG